MWTLTISIILTILGIIAARYLFGVSNAQGDGRMGLAIFGYGFVIVGALGGCGLVYKAATFGLS